MFERAIIHALRRWQANPRRKPLILRGARQVGKTTLINGFARYYDCYLPLNLEKKADQDIFLQDLPIDDLIKAIHFHKNQAMAPQASTLIFIDEIQNCPEAAASLRYFYEERSDIHVIAAGSLLETMIDKHISFPVGRVEFQWLYPLSFKEYLNAANQTEALTILASQPCPDFAHDKLLGLFYQYALIGGMPEAVATYLENQDIISVNKVYESLMTAYMADVEKYAPNRSLSHVIRHVMMHLPMAAGSRIKFQGFGQSNYKSREISEALNILAKAMLIQLIYPSVATVPPAQADYKKSPKLQFLDTGMMNFAAGLQQHYFKLSELCNLYQGQVSENIVGQELLANQLVFSQQLRFWVREKKQSNAEVDFVIPFKHYLIPIEVKAGKTGTLRSLAQFMEQAEHGFAVRIYAGKLQVDDLQTPSGKPFHLLSLPYYLIAQLPEYLSLLVEHQKVLA